MLLQNGRILSCMNVQTYGVYGNMVLNQHLWALDYGIFPDMAAVPVGYGFDGIVPCVTGGSMATRPAQTGMVFGGNAPINKGISISSTGEILKFGGTAALGAIIKITATGMAFQFSGSADIYGVAFMDAAGRALQFGGSAALGAVINIDATGGVTFGGSATTHSLAHLVTATDAGNLTPADLAALANAVWEAMTAAHQNTGTMGKAMAAAGSAGDPWSTDLTPYLTGTAGAKLKSLPNLGSIIATVGK